MELDFGGKKRVSRVNGEKNTYLFRDFIWKRPLQVVRFEEEMRVTTWSGIATGKTPR